MFLVNNLLKYWQFVTIHHLTDHAWSCILSLEKGLELMRESGEPMGFGIFDFYKVFSNAFGEEGNGAAGT